MYLKKRTFPKTFAKKKKTYRKRTFKKVGSLPARLRGNRTKYYINKQVSRAMHKMSETKLIGLSAQNETPPVAIQAGAQATFIGYILGTTNAGISGAIPVDGVTMSQGTLATQRIGNYIYFKKTHMTLRIEMNAGTNAPPIQFRFIVAKLRRYNNPSGVTPAFDTAGFMDENGNNFGHQTSGKTGLDLMMQPLNKRSWVIYKDFKFILQPYNDLASGGTSIIYNNYPAAKEIMLNLPHFKKAFFNGNTSLSSNDVDTRYIVIMYAHTLGRSGVIANSYDCSIRGTTSYTDN